MKDLVLFYFVFFLSQQNFGLVTRLRRTEVNKVLVIGLVSLWVGVLGGFCLRVFVFVSVSPCLS